MAKLICGVGCNSKREHKTFKDGKMQPSYVTWRGMIGRCYSAKAQARCPTYIGCSVSEDWYDYQDFAEWFNDHEYSNLGYELDKDLLVPDNKIYSPETCCFVPNQINMLLADSRAVRGKHPQGVSYSKNASKFSAQLNINGKKKHLGYFNCSQEAHDVYIVAKEAYVKEKALEWQDRIANDVFQSLMSWKFVG